MAKKNIKSVPGDPLFEAMRTGNLKAAEYAIRQMEGKTGYGKPRKSRAKTGRCLIRTTDAVLDAGQLVWLRITVSVPGRDVSPNGTAHWAKKAKAKELQKLEAFWEVRAALQGLNLQPPRWGRAILSLKWFGSRNLPPDPDNRWASIKSLLDGMAAAGMVVNDRDVESGKNEFLVDKENPRLELTMRKKEN